MAVLCFLVTFSSPAQAITRYVSVSGCGGIPSPCYAQVSAAVDASNGGDVIHIYPGTYLNEANLNTMDTQGNISLITVNASGVPTPGTATMTNSDVAPLFCDGFTGDITVNGLNLECTDNTPGNDQESGLVFRNVTGRITLIDVDARSTSWDGIAIYSCTGDVTITRCTAHNSYDDGFSISEGTTGNATITDSRAYENFQDGFQFDMTGNVILTDCLSENNDNPQIPDNDEDGFDLEVNGDINIDECRALNNGQEGIDIEFCSGSVSITDSTSQNNGGEGIDTDELGTGLLIERCRTLSNTGEGIQVASYQAPEGPITISCCDIAGNDEGLHLYEDATVQAINNWWGNASGPDESGNLGGTGDSIVIEDAGTVNYNPWLTTQFSQSAACGGSTQSIPTTDTWGMIIMATILALAAFKFMPRCQGA